MKILGRKIRVIKGKDYLGRTGVVEYCNKCCRKHRIQFDGIGNNVLYANYKDKIEFID